MTKFQWAMTMIAAALVILLGLYLGADLPAVGRALEWVRDFVQ